MLEMATVADFGIKVTRIVLNSLGSQRLALADSTRGTIVVVTLVLRLGSHVLGTARFYRLILL